jgi:hypothetical protein
VIDNWGRITPSPNRFQLSLFSDYMTIENEARKQFVGFDAGNASHLLLIEIHFSMWRIVLSVVQMFQINYTLRNYSFRSTHYKKPGV